ncbi:hypothetical protein CCACVL1_18363 [Corchorus capsularis]|uniref:Uncharacterized protein n=1 Tax=Corchorus capsularis TaxID=210143 RepID=A0A1R3HLI5_COCAP|nr:hypothetical protein CCACVL1_18363 [Corchorus capsularis]
MVTCKLQCTAAWQKASNVPQPITGSILGLRS